MRRLGGRKTLRDSKEGSTASSTDGEGAGTGHINQLSRLAGAQAMGGGASGGRGREVGRRAGAYGAADPRVSEDGQQDYRKALRMNKALNNAVKGVSILERNADRHAMAGNRTLRPRRRINTPVVAQPEEGKGGMVERIKQRRRKGCKTTERVQEDEMQRAQAGLTIEEEGVVEAHHMGVDPTFRTREGGEIKWNNGQPAQEREAPMLPVHVVDGAAAFAKDFFPVPSSVPARPALGEGRQQITPLMHHRGPPIYQPSATGQDTIGEQQMPVGVGLRRAAMGSAARGGRRGMQAANGPITQPFPNMPQDYAEDMRGPGMHGTPVGGLGMAAKGGRGEGHSPSPPPSPTAHAPLHARGTASGGGEPDPESARKEAKADGKEEKQAENKLGDVNDPTSLAWRLRHTSTIPSMEMEVFFAKTRTPWPEVVQKHPQASRLVDAATVHQGSIWAILSELGRGGFGAVFLALRIHSADLIVRNGHSRVRPRVYKGEPKRALKMIDMKKTGHDQAQPPRFGMACQEIEIMRRFNGQHPNLLKLLDTFVIKPEEEGAWPRKVCLVLELGRMTLETAARDYKLTIHHLRSYGYQVGSALKFLHDNGCYHLDIKVENVLLMEGNLVKLGDFGLAWHSSQNRELPSNCGTFSCAPPEFHLGLPLSKWADVWSYGVMMFEMLKGYLPFRVRGNDADKMVMLQAELVGLPATDAVWQDGMDELRGIESFNADEYSFEDRSLTLVESLHEEWDIRDPQLATVLCNTWSFAPSKRSSLETILDLNWFKHFNFNTGEWALAPEVVQPSLLGNLVLLPPEPGKPAKRAKRAKRASPFLRSRSTEAADDEEEQAEDPDSDPVLEPGAAPAVGETKPAVSLPSSQQHVEYNLELSEIMEEEASAHGPALGDGNVAASAHQSSFSSSTEESAVASSHDSEYTADSGSGAINTQSTLASQSGSSRSAGSYSGTYASDDEEEQDGSLSRISSSGTSSDSSDASTGSAVLVAVETTPATLPLASQGLAQERYKCSLDLSADSSDARGVVAQAHTVASKIGPSPNTEAAGAPSPATTGKVGPVYGRFDAQPSIASQPHQATSAAAVGGQDVPGGHQPWQAGHRGQAHEFFYQGSQAIARMFEERVQRQRDNMIAGGKSVSSYNDHDGIASPAVHTTAEASGHGIRRKRRIEQDQAMTRGPAIIQAAPPNMSMASKSGFVAPSAPHGPPLGGASTGVRRKKRPRGTTAGTTSDEFTDSARHEPVTKRPAFLFGQAGEALVSATFASAAASTPHGPSTATGATTAGRRKRSRQATTSDSDGYKPMANALARPVFAFGEAHKALAPPNRVPALAPQGGGEDAEAEGQARKKPRTDGAVNGNVAFQQAPAAGTHSIMEYAPPTEEEWEEL